MATEMGAAAEAGPLRRLEVPTSFCRADKPVPGIPALRYAPLFPMPIEAPRGPNVHPKPLPLRFIRTPGASLNDLRNRNPIIPFKEHDFIVTAQPRVRLYCYSISDARDGAIFLDGENH